MISGVCTAISPFFGYIPFPYIRRFGHIFNPKVVIPWFLIHGTICLFMTGIFGLLVAIMCFITVAVAIAGIFFALYGVEDNETY